MELCCVFVEFDFGFSIGYFWNIVSGDWLKGIYFVYYGGVF